MARTEWEYLQQLSSEADRAGYPNTGLDKMDACSDLLNGRITIRPWGARNSAEYYAGQREGIPAHEEMYRNIRNGLITMRMADILTSVPPGATIVEFGTGRAPAYMPMMWNHIGRIVAIDPVPEQVQAGINEGRLPRRTEIVSRSHPPYTTVGKNEATLVLSQSATHILTANELAPTVTDLYERTAPGGQLKSVIDTDVSPRFLEGIDEATSQALHRELLKQRNVLQPGGWKGLIQYASGVEEELLNAPWTHYTLGSKNAQRLRYRDTRMPDSLFGEPVLLELGEYLEGMAETYGRIADAPAELKSVNGIRAFLFDNPGPGLLQLVEPLRRLAILGKIASYRNPTEIGGQMLNAFAAYGAEQLLQDMHFVVLQQAAKQAGYRTAKGEKRAISIYSPGLIDAPMFHEGMAFPSTGKDFPLLVYREFTATK